MIGLFFSSQNIRGESEALTILQQNNIKQVLALVEDLSRRFKGTPNLYQLVTLDRKWLLLLFCHA